MTGKVAGHKGPRLRSFKGRAGQSEWYGGTVSCLFMMIVAPVVAHAIFQSGMVALVAALPWVIAQLALSARRLHDIGESAKILLAPIVIGGLWSLALFLYGAIKVGGNLAQLPTTMGGDADDFWVLGVMVAIGAFVVIYVGLAFLPGSKGPNVYGEADL